MLVMKPQTLSNLMLKAEADLATQIANEKKYWLELSGERMVTDAQAAFVVSPPTLPFSSNFTSQSLSRLLLYTFDWIKTSNNAFKLLEYAVLFYSYDSSSSTIKHFLSFTVPI